MSDTGKGSSAEGQPSTKQWEQIKEKLKASWQRNDPAPFDKVAFVTAASEAGISDSSMLADMILYAGYASQLPVKRSGQSAFSWVPLVAVAVAAQSMVSPEKRSEALSLINQGLVSVGKEAEADGVLEGESMPVDLMAAAEHIDGVMLSLRKASRLGLAGASFGRPRNLKQTTATLTSAVTALEALPADQRTDTAVVQKAFKRLVTEVEAAKQLRNRAVEALADTEAKETLSPAHQAVTKAIFAHQGPALERELAELKGSVQDADAALETAKVAMKNAGLDADEIADEAGRERRERLASRPERPKGNRRRTGRRRRARGPAADGSSAENETAEDTDQEVEEPNTTHAGENGENNGGNRQRRGGRTRGERRRPRGGRDFTAPRDAASEDDEEEDGGGPQGGPNGGASPSGREGASVPPGFGSQHGIADGNKEIHPEGERRRRGGRGQRDKAAGSNDQNDASAQAAGETGGTEQTESVGEGGKRGRRNRGGRRGKPRSAHDGNAIAPATGAAGNRMARNSLQTFDNPTFADGDGADAGNGAEKEDAEVEVGRRERRKRPSLKDVARILEGIKRDLCDPITKAPLRDPVAAADGFTYERASIEEHLLSHRTSPVTGEALPSTSLFPSALASSLLERLADCDAAAV